MKIRFRSIRHQIKLKYYNFRGEFSEMGVFERIIYLYEIPVDLIRNLTIPPTDDE